MAGNANPLISGTAMSVIIGGGCIISSFFIPGIGLGERIILLFLGLLFFLAGLAFSQA
jgi:hypothetical protein